MLPRKRSTRHRLEEAADVLIVLMSITEFAGIDWQAVVNQAWAKVRGLETKPTYKGEHIGEATDLTQLAKVG